MSQASKDSLKVFNRFVESFADKVKLGSLAWNPVTRIGTVECDLLDVGIIVAITVTQSPAREEEEKAR